MQSYKDALEIDGPPLITKLTCILPLREDDVTVMATRLAVLGIRTRYYQNHSKKSILMLTRSRLNELHLWHMIIIMVKDRQCAEGSTISDLMHSPKQSRVRRSKLIA